MGVLDMDFGSVERSNKLPEGEYIFVVESVEETTSKAGDPMWKLKLTVVNDENDGKYVGRTQPAQLLFMEKTMWATANALDAILGIKMEGPLGDYISESSDLVGKTVGGMVTHKDDYANITTWFAA